MKKLYSLIIFLSFLQLCYSQCSDKNVFVSFGLGSAIPFGQVSSNVEPGVGLILNAGVELKNNFSIAIQNNLIVAEANDRFDELTQFENAIFFGDEYNLNLSVVKLQYKFFENEFSSFIGFGVGASILYDPLLPRFQDGNSSEGRTRPVLQYGTGYLFESGITFKDFIMTISMGVNGRTAERNTLYPATQDLLMTYYLVTIGYKYSFKI